MSYKKFDKSVLTAKQKDKILDIINTVRGEDIFKNSLYGMFDGYFYNDLMSEAKRILTKKEFNTLNEITKSL